jgi:ATP-dependent DNA helicase RecQ
LKTISIKTFSSFLGKHFKRQQGRSKSPENITPKKYKQLFDSCPKNKEKLLMIKKSKYIVVAAGPGSGKTKVLVHKLASLLLMEDVKHDQLLMLTFFKSSCY